MFSLWKTNNLSLDRDWRIIMLDKLFRTIRKIVMKWDGVELFIAILLTFVFLPWSLIYWGFRIVQEWE